MPRIMGMTTSASDPASRVRFIQFMPHLERAGWQVTHRPNQPDRQWSSSLPGRLVRSVHHRLGRIVMKVNRLRDIQAASLFDVVFVNRDLAGGGLFFEKRLLARNPRVIFDFDDAIFISRNEPAVRWMCQHATWITPGNEYLAEYVRRYTDRVTVIPTVIDTDSYIPRVYDQDEPDGRVRVGWTGSDQSIGPTLFPFLPMLAELQQKIDFDFVIISNSKPVLPVSSLRWTFWEWSPEGDTQLASRMDIGLMPLVDNEFQRGKCGLKLLQYMAAGIPTIASPVGVNTEITEQENTGFLATTPAEWKQAIEALLRSSQLRAKIGCAGRKRCEQWYSIRRWLPVLLNLFDQVSQGAALSPKYAAASLVSKKKMA